MGETTAALVHLERGLALYDPARHASQAFLYGGHDAGACCRYHLALTHWLLGYPDRAGVTLGEALSLVETLAHARTTVSALYFAALL